MRSEAVVILAAGAGTRLGVVAKALLLDPDGRRTYLEHILATARAAGITEAIVVVGPPHADAVSAHALQLGCRIAVNSTPERGMASSVSVGFAALASSACDAAWLWPVDHPDVEATTLEALRAALGSHVAVRPTYQGRGGHPPLISRALWPDLVASADVEGGARRVLAAAHVRSLEVEDRGVVRDIDTPADLEAR